MPRNGAGTYSLPAGNPVVTGTTISSTWANNTLSDISTALTNSIAKDGQTSPTANLPMAGYKHTGAGSANALTDYARADQVANSTLQYLTGVSGTDTITASAPITPAAYAAGQSFKFISAGANTTTSVTLNVSGLGAIAVKKNGTTALAVGDIPAAMMVEVIFDGTNFQLYGVTKLNALTTGTSANNLVQLNSSAQLPAVDGSLLTGISFGNDFRLTLTSATPVTTTDVTGATTIYCCPYKGDRIALYDGSAWNIRTSAQFSLALGTLTSGSLYDIFVYDNSGTPALELSAAWSNSTPGSAARFASGPYATALPTQDGIYVKSTNGTAIDATRRYLGTFYTTSTTTTEDSATKRYLWNYYNRVASEMHRVETTASWTYNSATVRQANGSTLNQLNFIVGVSEDSISATCLASASNSATSMVINNAIGYDNTTTRHANCLTNSSTGATSNRCSASSSLSLIPSAGVHYLAWLEASSTVAANTTFYGADTYAASGISASFTR